MLPWVSLLGLFCILGLCWACSRDRRSVSWRLVGVGLAIQLLLAAAFLSWQPGRDLLFRISAGFTEFLGLADRGSRFVFGPLADAGAVRAAFPEGGGGGFVFAFQALTVIIFFSAVVAVLYHIGVMQLLVAGMARITSRLLGTSGAESLSACGNVFVGQTEAPLMVRPFLPRMTSSELHAVMTGGFATIAGSVFGMYVLFLRSQESTIAAGHLMVASVMAVPAGLVCSKVLWPERERSETFGRVVRVELEPRANVVDAAAAGASDGLRLALNVGAMLIAFLGLVELLNWLLGGLPPLATVPHLTGEVDLVLSVEMLLGLIFYPIAAVMGVRADEVFTLSQLLGTKIAVTELVAYRELGRMEDLSPRTVKLATFALCGFANLGSVAIQVGGLSALAPTRRADLSRLALRAMAAGALATCMTACMAGFVEVFGATMEDGGP